MVPVLDYQSIKPRDMWKLIAARQPVVINGISKAWDTFTDDWLLSKAGDAVVLVEQRGNSKEPYGQGKKAPMRFGQLIEELQKGNSGLYMSTQEVGVGRDGHPLLYGPPLVQLAGEFPLQPPLMGNLVPQSVNMWMGCAPDGSSTGLHHDFHDNLYVLLRGCKRFRLFPPGTAPDMYVRGKLRRIHPNGRIVYEGQGDVLPDGSDKQDVQLWQARRSADEAAAAAAAAADPSHADDAEELLEQQLERMLAEGAGLDADGDLADDYMDSDQPADEDGCGAWESDGSAADKPASKSSKRQRKGLDQPQRQQPQHKKQKQAAAKAAAAAAAAAPCSAVGPAGGPVEPPPPSFSQVDLTLPEAVLRRTFPRFPGLAACEEVLLQAGQMLYIPAGWFHEVTSFGGGGVDGGHLAINYWFHPPDNLDSSPAGFKQPYSSPYYPSLWAQRQPWLVQDTQRWWEHQQQQQQQHKQQAADTAAVPAAAAAAANGKQGLPISLHVKTAVKRVGWGQGVRTPSNRYRMSMTKEGTATGHASRAPQDSQPGGGPCCGVLGCTEPDGGSESDSPCSREPAQVKAVTSGKGKGQQQQQQQKSSHAQHTMQHADECTLRHLSAAAGAKPLIADGSGMQAAAGSRKTAAHTGDAEDEASMSKEVRAGIAAVEDYFSENVEAMEALLQEFLARRRRRIAAGNRAGGPKVVGLPRLLGRRHHHYAGVKLVPRKPARQ